MKNCDICANDVFRASWKQTGVQPLAFQPPSATKRRNRRRQRPDGDGIAIKRP